MRLIDRSQEMVRCYSFLFKFDLLHVLVTLTCKLTDFCFVVFFIFSGNGCLVSVASLCAQLIYCQILIFVYRTPRYLEDV